MNNSLRQFSIQREKHFLPACIIFTNTSGLRAIYPPPPKKKKKKKKKINITLKMNKIAPYFPI